jgi:hypothetical protein
MLVEINQEHYATVNKNRTGKYQDEILQKPDEKVRRRPVEWLDTGSAHLSITKHLNPSLKIVAVVVPVYQQGAVIAFPLKAAATLVRPNFFPGHCHGFTRLIRQDFSPIHPHTPAFFSASLLILGGLPGFGTDVRLSGSLNGLRHAVSVAGNMLKDSFSSAWGSPSLINTIIRFLKPLARIPRLYIIPSLRGFCKIRAEAAPQGIDLFT